MGARTGRAAPHWTASRLQYRPLLFSLVRCRDVVERVDHFAAGLEQEGLTPPNPDGMKLLALYSRNRPEWVIAEQVCAVPCHGSRHVLWGQKSVSW